MAAGALIVAPRRDRECHAARGARSCRRRLRPCGVTEQLESRGRWGGGSGVGNWVDYILGMRGCLNDIAEEVEVGE